MIRNVVQSESVGAGRHAGRGGGTSFRVLICGKQGAAVSYGIFRASSDSRVGQAWGRQLPRAPAQVSGMPDTFTQRQLGS